MWLLYNGGADHVLEAGAAHALSGPGPVVVWLKVEGKKGQKTPQAPRPMAEQIRRLREALGA